MLLPRRILLAYPLAYAAAAVAAPRLDVARFDRARVLSEADRFLNRAPVTVTASRSPRSAGGTHDFFSEGDYWWPDPKDPAAPYLRRDGMTNPDNFVEHRDALMRLSVEMPALTAAWKVTRRKKYAEHAARHLRAWFVDGTTRMNPHLEYAQAIHGRSKGRGTGIIDTIHLVEVARAAPLVAESGALRSEEFAAVRKWFSDYLLWMTTSANGVEERDARNNHGTCFAMQVAAFARLTGQRDLIDDAARRFETIIVPLQVAPDGSQPLEISRTKPYGYCLFNLEAMAVLCQLVSEQGGRDLWRFETGDGRGIRRAIEFLLPYIADKKRWPHPPDVMYFEQWPMRQQALLFGGLAYGRQEYLDLWKTLPASSQVAEVVRNYFIRQPALWT